MVRGAGFPLTPAARILTPEPDIRVILSDDQKIEVDHDRIVEVAMRTAGSEGARGEISVSLVDEDRMAELHLEYMNEPGPTDVLSFPLDGFQPAPIGDSQSENGPPVLIGEVVICPFVAAASGRDLVGELDLLVAHGVLHLLGHDHEDEPRAQRMRAAERRITGRSGARAR